MLFKGDIDSQDQVQRNMLSFTNENILAIACTNENLIVFVVLYNTKTDYDLTKHKGLNVNLYHFDCRISCCISAFKVIKFRLPHNWDRLKVNCADYRICLTKGFI